MDRLSELLGQAVQFAYTCWDRIVLTGYIERLQRPENLISDLWTPGSELGDANSGLPT